MHVLSLLPTWDLLQVQQVLFPAMLFDRSEIRNRDVFGREVPGGNLNVMMIYKQGWAKMHRNVSCYKI